jgi:hypothetical protein
MPQKEFADQLEALGYQPHVLDAEKLTFPYKIPVGKFIGQDVQLGLIVGADFPLSPPSGPHLHPRLLPVHPGGEHPSGGINESPFGAEWEYWSRPFPDWPATDRTVRAYLAHIRHLFATQ